MANLSITPANVKTVTRASSKLDVQSGVDGITAGQMVYKKASSGLYHPADCETSEATADAVGISLTPGDEDDWFRILTDGPVELGVILTQGEAYFVSTAGLIMPKGDLATDDWVSFIGMASSTSILDVSLKNFAWQIA